MENSLLVGFMENRVSDSVYQNDLWPHLEVAIDLMLSSGCGDSRRISFEETYRFV